MLIGIDGVPFWTRNRGVLLASLLLGPCPPRPPVDTIHDRMPLIIPREGYPRWLQADADVSGLLEPSESTLVAVSVSSHVNSPNNDDAKCIEPAPVMQPTLFG
jgi:putative SOS response-associated peptidase YedK